MSAHRFKAELVSTEILDTIDTDTAAITLKVSAETARRLCREHGFNSPITLKTEELEQES
jgi:hypothetical protein